MLRNGLDEAPRFPLAAGTLTYLGFEADTSGIRYTGDTLVVELADSAGSLLAREYLSMGSPSRAQDSAAIGYGLALEGDSLTVDTRLTPVTSRLFGRIDGTAGVLPLTGLKPVRPEFRFGIPILETGADMLSGRLEGEFPMAGRRVSGPWLLLDGRSIPIGRPGLGFLYTPDGGLERAWRFGGRDSIVKGWDRK
jgi:hypothetical protein